MTIDLFHVWADGTLANPHVAVGVAAWTAVLSGLAVWTVRRRWFAGSALALLVCLLITPAAQRALARLSYGVYELQVVSVHFYGAPPVWIAPAVAGAAGALAWLYTVARRR